jgi:mono/diheme cytochrome c family protein
LRAIKFLIPFLVALVGLVAFVFLFRGADLSPGVAPAIAGAPPNADPVARGEYLAKAADCVACHTMPGSGRSFAGGLAFKLPFGTIYSSNITADPESGIGNWTDEDFIRAVREGVRKDGAHLYPAFPYTSYAELSRNDVLAIKAYLFSQPRIRYRAPRNALSFPFNQRWAMGVWNIAFFNSRRFEPDQAKSPQWNAGAYLANALGHCGECHTPRNFAFAIKTGETFAGEDLQGWRAYNITSDQRYGIGKWTDEELAEYLNTGHAKGRGAASGPMSEVVTDSLQYWDRQDISALVAYLRSVPAREGAEPIETSQLAHLPREASSNDDVEGEDSLGLQLFAGACASCHGLDGSGRQIDAAALLGAKGVNDPVAANASEMILNGGSLEVAGHRAFMPAFGRGYTDAEIAALSNFVVRHFGAKEGIVNSLMITNRRSSK